MSSAGSSGTGAGGGFEVPSSGAGGESGETGDAGQAGEADLGGGDDGGSSPGTGGASANGGAAGGGHGGAAGIGSQGGSGGEGGLINGNLLDCGSRDVTGATLITEPITQSTTLSGVVHLPQGLSLRNEATLTIAPGAKLIVGSGATIELGWMNSHPTIIAAGTAQAPIRICGETDTKGYWGDLIVRSSVTSSSVLRNVLIADGGKNSAALVLESPMLVQGVQILNSGKDGARAPGFVTGSSTLIVSGATWFPLDATDIGAVEIPPGSVLTGNGYDAINLAFTGFTRGATFKNFGVPYHLSATTVGAYSDKPTIIEAGVTIELGAQQSLSFSGSTQFLGDTAHPILFRGYACQGYPTDSSCTIGSPKYARGGRVSVDGDVTLNHVQFSGLGFSTRDTTSPYATHPYGVLTVGNTTSFRVNGLEITGAYYWGIRFQGTGAFSSDSTGLDLSGLSADSSTDSFEFSGSTCGYLLSLPADTLVPQQAQSLIENCIATATGTVRALTRSYTVKGFDIGTGGNVTVEPGTRFSYPSGTSTWIRTGATLTAAGSVASPILFKYSGSILAGPGWLGLIVDVGSTVVLDHVVVDGGGGVGAGSAYRANIAALAPLTLTNSTISNSFGWGLRKAAADTTDYSATNVFSGNKYVDIGPLP